MFFVFYNKKHVFYDKKQLVFHTQTTLVGCAVGSQYQPRPDGERLFKMYPSRLSWARFTKQQLKSRLYGTKNRSTPWPLGLHSCVSAHFKVEEPCKIVTEIYFDFYCQNFCKPSYVKKIEKWPKLRKLFSLKFDFSFLKKLIQNLKKKKILLQGRATLPLWFEPKHDFVGPAATEWIYVPIGLRRSCFSAVGLFLGQKSKISQEQNVKEFQFYIRMQNFRLLGSIIKKKVQEGSRFP